MSHGNIISVRESLLGERVDSPDDIRRLHAKALRNGSDIEQIDHAVEVLGTEDLILLHACSTYPAYYQELNLRVIPLMKQRYGVPIGYSGHETGIPSTVGARGRRNTAKTPIADFGLCHLSTGLGAFASSSTLTAQS